MNSIGTQLTRTAAAGALGVAAVAGFTAPASAAQQAAAQTAVTAHAAATVPNTNIEGSPAKWHPAELTIRPASGTGCTSASMSFTIDNKTKRTQTILYKTGEMKKVLTTLSAGGEVGVCDHGKKGTVIKNYIKGSRSVLTESLR